MATIFSHNGTFTITSAKSGDYRTFRIKTQAADAKFAPGSRVVSLLSGPSNESDYRGFGFVNDNGIALWGRQKASEFFQKSAKMLENMVVLEKNGHISVKMATKCRICNRKLTTPESIESGIGPICATK